MAIIIGNDDDNILQGTPDDDFIDGRGGSFDQINYGAATSGVTVNLSLTGPQAIGGGQGIDTLVNIEAIHGSYYSDTLTGDSGNNNFQPRAGDDRVDGGDGWDTVDYGAAAGGVNVSLAMVGAQAVGADQGLDTLLNIEGIHASPHADTLTGGAGSDYFQPRGGDDVVDGGDGFDQVDYAGASGGVAVDLSLPTSQAIGADQGLDTLLNIEGLFGSFHNDSLSGSVANNWFNPRAGNDLVDGGAGSDTVVFTGARSDYAFAVSGSQVVVTDLRSGSPDGTDTLIAVERLAFSDRLVLLGTPAEDILSGTPADDEIHGLGGDDTVVGEAGNDSIFGDDGADFLNGQQGDDTLEGGAGLDVFRGGSGNDVIIGGPGLDRVSHFPSGSDQPAGGVTVSLLLQGQPQFTGHGWDTLISIEALSGSPYDDRLTGDNNENWLIGGGIFPVTGQPAGNDTLSGQGGDDLLEAGFGDHVLDGGDGVDTASFFGLGATSGPVTVWLELQGSSQDTGQGRMTLVSIENLSGTAFDDRLTGDRGDNLLAGDNGSDTLVGGKGNDTLLGDGMVSVWWWEPSGGIATAFSGAGTGNDVLDGGKGEDVLVGGGGADRLTGGAQADRFVFLAVSDSTLTDPDVIIDLEKKDLIDLSAIDADMHLAGDQAFDLVATFTGSVGQAVLTYDGAAKLTRLSLDVDGDGAADMVIHMLGRHDDFTGFVF